MSGTHIGNRHVYVKYRARQAICTRPKLRFPQWGGSGLGSNGTVCAMDLIPSHFFT